MCFRRQNTEAFLEGLIQALAFFGGTPRRVLFDNARGAVKEGTGKTAIPQESYAALAAHSYLCLGVPTMPAARQSAAPPESFGLALVKREHFPLHKTLEEFDLSCLQHIQPEFIKQLASCSYIDRHENLVLMGNPAQARRT